MRKNENNKKENYKETDFMKIALIEAQKGAKENEVPIGAVIVQNGKVISRAHNKREKKQNALYHAEILAINKACKKLKSWRLEDCEMFVTLEPCPMCCGAIINARLKKVTYAAKEKTSNDGLFEKIMQSTRLNHNCLVAQDEQNADASAKLLADFFKQKRK